jgi:hypothetical protein
MDPDPKSIFIIDLQDAKKTNLKKVFLHISYFLKVLLYHFSKVSKSQKEVTKTAEIKVFLIIFA